MNRANRWGLFLIARVGVNALAGGILVALVGALCMGAGGGVAGAIIDISQVPGESIYARMGARNGVEVGALSGLAGVFIFGIAALKAAPNDFFAPLRALSGRVAAGQVLGTLGTATSFFLYEYAKTHWSGRPFGINVFRDAFFLLLAAPVLMICGAIAGALSKRQTRESATLKAE